MRDIDLSRTDLNLLVVFEAVLQEQHVGRAGQRLNLSPSAVSHGLNRLRRAFNDPLFLRTPKGVVPTARAQELAPRIAEVLDGVRGLVAAATPFDPAISSRRFSLGVPDVDAVMVIPPIIEALERCAPSVVLSVRAVLPFSVLEELEARRIDIAVTPFYGEPPKRFHHKLLRQESFVIVMRKGHPYARAPSLDAYCRFGHAVMSLSGDPHGFMDMALEAVGRRRPVLLTLPNFISILTVLQGTDLLAAVPRGIAERFSSTFGLTWTELPLAVERARSEIILVAAQAALADTGIAWLYDVLERVLMRRPGPVPADVVRPL